MALGTSETVEQLLAHSLNHLREPYRLPTCKTRYREYWECDPKQLRDSQNH